MLERGRRRNAANRLEQDQAIRTGVTASAIAHLSIVALLVLMSEVHPFGSSTEPIAVDIVTPQEIEPEKSKEKLEPEETTPFKLPDPAVPAQQASSSPGAAPEPAPQTAATPPQTAASQPASRPERRGASVAAAPPAQLGSASPAYRPPEPDLSVKYNVLLGLPMDAPPMVNPGKSDDGFDATASSAADISSSVIAEFKKHLKTCSKLPPSVKPSDHIIVKLRVLLAQDGRLAAEPAIGGGSANMKAIELLQSAIAAVKQCQPYKMLPVDRYGEWKVLDLDFTPKDFSG
jgi:predicted component of type VI protein secretion system